MPRAWRPAIWWPPDLVYRDRTGENYLMTYRPSHRWFYAEMRTDVPLALRLSAEDGFGMRCFPKPHIRALDPTAPADRDVLPRESIELRTFVFYSA
jgi:hypothetical protein